MKRLAQISTTAVVVLLAMFTVDIDAQQPDTHDRTIMTFSGAVELPGLRLEPGTYVFRLADTPSRNVIQVLSKDEMDVLGQWLFVPTERQEATDDTVVTFRETSANATPAIQFWFYPGERIGKEFIYPKDQALRIAERSGGTVLSEEGRVTAREAAIRTEEDQPVGTSGRDDEVRQESTVVASVNDQAAVADLPRTASPMVISGLIGLLALVGATGIRAFRN